ncbi:hypothetical protein OG478_12605 [Streptomyces phaeochromogenes]|uniref:hypothetical protein n=1 Tax=Streptomyces phaeochromogenes TaxID=1923 RepID=UPI003868C9D4|nr:hypothetical protein OG478_12605 [Streptomyces phaeochromogenes]
MLVDAHAAALGADHVDTIVCRTVQASEHCEFDLHDDGIMLHAGLVADRARVQGPDHADTLKARWNLVCAVNDGMFGRKLYPALRSDCLRVLGRGHPLTQAVLEHATSPSCWAR